MKSCFDLRDGEELFVRCLGSRLGLESGITKLLLCFQQTTLSLLITSVHSTSGSLGESTQTAQIVNEWADLVLSFRQPTIICMDSYYLCKVGRETLRQKNVRFIAAIKPDRFKRITALLTLSVQNAGKSAYAFIGDRNEAAVMHWSRDTNIGKKFVLTNCFTRVPQKKPSDYVPVYDEYKSLFSGCDKFNQQLYGKNFPYQAPNDTNLAEKKNIWNYLFTSVLINVWNVCKGVLQARDPETETMSFRDFCDDLSVRIVEELCFYCWTCSCMFDRVLVIKHCCNYVPASSTWVFRPQPD